MKFNPRTFLFIIAVIVAILLIVVGPAYQKKQETKKLSGLVSLAETRHIYGSPDAPVTLIEYSDIECPYCKSAHPVIKSIVDNSGGKVKWVYKHFPLTSIHPKALPFAAITECVAKTKGNDAFWKVLDSLMANGDEKSALALVGLNIGMLNSCLTDESVVNKIQEGVNQAADLGVGGTPYILINGPKGTEKIPGSPQKAQLEAMIADQLK